MTQRFDKLVALLRELFSPGETGIFAPVDLSARETFFADSTGGRGTASARIR